MENQIAIQIPQSVENLNLPDPELKTYYENLEDRKLWIDQEISEYSLEYIRNILNWNKEDKGIPIAERKPIQLFFFSPGGDLDVNYSLIDVISMSVTPIIGVNMGRCCSAAAYIYLSCHHRYMLPHSYFVFHQGSGQLSGTYNEIYSQMEDYQQQVSELSNLMKSCTKYTKEEIENSICTEWYVRADEALEKGVCEKIIKNIEDVM